ncbi:MAG: hypothetical protein ABI444_10895 [Candidatus Kapaibacterium sp.]|jgi:hypothetical protein
MSIFKLSRTLFFPFVLSIAVLFMSGCTPSTDSGSGKLDPFVLIGLNGPLKTLLDTTEVDALVLISVADYHDSLGATLLSSYADATFTKNGFSVAIGSATANGVALAVSQLNYVATDSKIYDSTKPQIVFKVTGYDGIDFQDSGLVPQITPVNNLKPFDTVSASGFKVTYDGATNATWMLYSMSYDAALNKFKLGSSTAGSGYFQSKSSDLGTVNFTNTQISAFSTNRFYQLDLERYTYHVRTLSDGKKVGFLCVHDYQMPVYLK